MGRDNGIILLGVRLTNTVSPRCPVLLSEDPSLPLRMTCYSIEIASSAKSLLAMTGRRERRQMVTFNKKFLILRNFSTRCARSKNNVLR